MRGKRGVSARGGGGGNGERGAPDSLSVFLSLVRPLRRPLPASWRADRGAHQPARRHRSLAKRSPRTRDAMAARRASQKEGGGRAESSPSLSPLRRRRRRRMRSARPAGDGNMPSRTMVSSSTARARGGRASRPQEAKCCKTKEKVRELSSSAPSLPPPVWLARAALLGTGQPPRSQSKR